MNKLLATSFVLLLTLVTTVSALAEMSQETKLIGSWKYRNEKGKAVSLVIVHECEVIPDKKEVCHVEVANFTPGQAPGYKRLVIHLAITADALRRSIVEPAKKTLNFYPEEYEGALASWKENALNGDAQICDFELVKCLITAAVS